MEDRITEQAENNHQENNKRIARNALYLYGQMLVQLIVSLVTARVVFNTLGEIDYGIFSIVGGVMSIFIVLNSLESATMRFITFEQGQGSGPEKMHIVFSTAGLVHLSIAGIVFVLAETFGMYYVCNYLVIPPERLTATIIIYQFSIITSIFSIMCAPYDALIVAHERMGVFASIGIYNVLINLIIIFLVKYTRTDKLILYAALMMLIQVSLRLIYGFYCNRSFKETNGKWIFDKALFIKMLKFGGWSFNGTLAAIGYTQGINLLLNFFYGPILNAAYGVASTIQNKVYTFADNFLTAVKPQIVKSYASGDMTYLHKLIITSSRFSVMLLFFISLPVLLETSFMLFIWLGDVPEYTVWFVRLSLMMMIVDTLGRVMCMAIHATGNIAKFQMIEANMLLLTVPIAWVCLKIGLPPTIVFLVQLIIFILTQAVRIFIVCPAIKLSIWTYIKDVILRSTLVITTGSIIPTMIHIYGNISEHPLTQIIIVTSTSLLSSGMAIYYIGCDQKQRQIIINKTKSILKSIKFS